LNHLKIFGLCLFLLTLISASGCGPGGVTVTGTVVGSNGAAISLEADEAATVMLISDDAKVNCSGEVDKATGTFKIGQPVPPGIYKVQFVRYSSNTAKGPPATMDYPEKWAVSSTNNKFTLDISKLREAEQSQ